jgi:hypothetical protein
MQGVKFKTREVFAIGSIATITYTVNENYFRGRTTLQLMVDKVISNPRLNLGLRKRIELR